MEEKVLVRVLGGQMEDGNMEQQLELVTHGTLRRQPDAWVLEYREADLSDGSSGTDTRVVMRDGCVSMQRSGAFEAYMVFEKWKTYSGKLSTPLGDVDMSVFSTDVSLQLNEEQGRGRVDIEYDVHTPGGSACNQFLLRFHTTPGSDAAYR